MHFSQSLWCQCAGDILLSLGKCPVHLELTIPGVETQPYPLPWADADCAGTGGISYQQHVDIILWSNTAKEMLVLEC